MAMVALLNATNVFGCTLDEGASLDAKESVEQWSMVFSNPEDFIPCDLEADRWIVLVSHAFRECGVRPLQADLLGRQIASSSSRFVAILDDRLGVRRTFTYERRLNLPSPLEFLGWAVALRSRDRGLERIGCAA